MYKPKIGDVIRVGKSKTVRTVVDAGTKFSYDRVRNDPPYNVDWFLTVNFTGKEKYFYFNDGSMHHKGQQISRDAVTVLAKAKVKKIVTKPTYHVSLASKDWDKLRLKPRV